MTYMSCTKYDYVLMNYLIYKYSAGIAYFHYKLVVICLFMSIPITRSNCFYKTACRVLCEKRVDLMGVLASKRAN